MHRDAAEVLICAAMSVQNPVSDTTDNAAPRQRRILVADDNRDADVEHGKGVSSDIAALLLPTQGAAV